MSVAITLGVLSTRWVVAAALFAIAVFVNELMYVYVICVMWHAVIALMGIAIVAG